MAGRSPFIVPNGGFVPSGGGGGSGSPDGIVSVSAGTTFETGPGLSFANSNNVSFGMSGSTITASVVPDAGIGLAVVGSTVSTGTVVLADSNGISFGLNGSTVTASVAAGATATGNFGALGAGTQTATSGTVVFANSNGLTFGMSNSTQITASVSREPVVAVNAAGSVTAGTVVLSNSNNITFGLNGSTITASASFSTAPGAIAAGTQTATSGTIAFVNSNGLTFGMSNSTQITASVAAGATATGNLGALAAGTQTATSGTIALVNSNGLTFGMSNSTQITGSYSQSTAPNAIAVNAAGSVTAGTAVLSNSNGVSFGLNGSTITASIAAGATATGNFGAIAGGTQTATSGTVNFANSNGITFGMSGSSQITASVSREPSIAAGTQTGSSGTIVFSNSNGFTFGMSNSSVVTASYTQSTAPAAIAVNAAGSVTAGTAVFSNSNNITFGLNGSTITASAGGGGATMSLFENQLPISSNQLATVSESMRVFRLSVPANISATRLELLRGTNGGNLSVKVCMFTMGGSTANSVFSTSATWSSFNPGASTTVTSVPLGTWSITPGDYLFGIGASGNADVLRIGGPPLPLVPAAGATSIDYFRDAVATNSSATAITLSQLSSPTPAATDVRPYVRLLGTF